MVRVAQMAESFTQHQQWRDVLAHEAALDAVTREDVVRVAKRYLGDGRVVVTRRRGKPTLPKIDKPQITPVAIDSSRSSKFAKRIAALPNAADKLPEPATPKTSDPSGLKPPPEQPPGGDDKLKTSNAESPSPPVTKCAVSEPCIDPATAKLVKGSLWGLFTASAVTSIALLSINFTSAGTKVDVNGNEITRQLWYPGWTAAGISLAILAIAIPTTHIVNRRVLKDPAPSN